MTGIELITKERQEQLEKHGISIQNDIDNNANNQLVDSALRLIMQDEALHEIVLQNAPQGWNRKIWKKMCKKPYTERLIIAGALIAAEIDRIQNLN